MGKQSYVEPAKSIKNKAGGPGRDAPAAASSAKPAEPVEPLVLKPAPTAIKDKPEAMRSRQKPEPEWSIPKSEFVKVKISQICDEGYNARVEIDESTPKFAELCQSIKMAGLVEPIVLTPLDDEKKARAGLIYDLVAGFRRFRALRKVGSREKMAVLHHYSHPAQRIIVNLLENQHREDLRAYEEARAFRKLKDEGFRVETIAEKLAISESKVNNYISCVDNLVPELLEVFKKNSEGTTLSMLISMSRAPKEEQESYYRALSMTKSPTAEEKPKKEPGDKGPKARNKDQMGGFLGDLVRAESILIDGDEVLIEEADPRMAIEAAMRWARGEIKAYPLVLPPGDKSPRFVEG